MLWVQIPLAAKMRLVSSISKEELTSAIKQTINMTQLIKKLNFADGDTTRIKVKNLITQFNIDISHFISRKIPFSDEIILERRQEATFRASKKISENRKNPEFRAKFLFEDCRNSDRKRFRTKNDLTIDFIKSLIINGCIYCGEIKIQMSLDIIDNSKPHYKNNVNSSCIRCNLIRNSMPYEAWLIIIPSIRISREKKLFDNWIHKKFNVGSLSKANE